MKCQKKVLNPLLKKLLQVCFYMYFLDTCGHHEANSGWLVLSRKRAGLVLWV